MVRNMTGGKGHKKGKRSTGDKKRIIEYADEINSLYGLVISPLGDCKFLVHCNDNNERIGVIRGSLYKNTFITPGDVVLVTLRDFEKSKTGSKERCDIVIKYMANEIDQLKRKKIYYLNTNNPFNLTLDKGTSKKSKENDTEQISFNTNVIAQVTLKDLPEISEDEEEEKTFEELKNEVSESSNIEDEDEDEDEDDDNDNDEYGNNKKYINQELTSKSKSKSKSSDEEEESEEDAPIQPFQNKRGVYADADDDFM
jgi:initiation factor 1A